MNAQLTTLRTLVLKELDPMYYQLDKKQVDYWLKEIPLIEAEVLNILQTEVMGGLKNSLVERHLKQLQYDCTFLLNALYKYTDKPDAAACLYQFTESCLQHILMDLDERYTVSFRLQQDSEYGRAAEDYRIRVLLSAEALAYFFKLLYKAGVLDSGPVSRLIVSLSKNFTTRGVGNAQLSSGSLMTKYKQVVQTTAKSVRALLVKMTKQLDDEFTIS
ncbi:hypothetical protein [Pedobacter nyackensis]|uniref:hypothetical protein n=1 Tax=Pedobacter nyackensis TaxID=475255 RepID=UPI00292E9671|nr:hypothetical protein [Pedobacter nyackensis]